MGMRSEFSQVFPWWLATTSSSNMLGKLIGQKYFSIARTWVPTLAVWGSVGGVALVHFTDWRLILDYVPYVSGKYKNDD
ncbi:cytochrome b-c1 complex subunit 10 [Salvelinus sp. IW2-2015]|nr:cytochrome b-c1 complex subunit 10 [Salvelinus alpinus]